MIILGAVITVAGGFFIIKTEWFLSNFGRLSWFEDKLGSEGGSRLGYKIIGIILLVVGIIMMTGSGGNFFSWLLEPLTKYSNPS
jgi:fatty acid desaturase